MPRTRKTSAKTKELKDLATEAIVSEAASGESVPPSETETAGTQTAAPAAPDAAKTREETAVSTNDTAAVAAKDEANDTADEAPSDTAKPAAAPITAVLRLNTVPSDTRLSQKSRKVKSLF